MQRIAVTCVALGLLAAGLWTSRGPAMYPAPSPPAAQVPAAPFAETAREARPFPDTNMISPARSQAAASAWHASAQPPAEEFAADLRAEFHPHGREYCSSGCAASNHPTEPLTEAHFRELLAEFAAAPLAEPGLPLDTLLYFGRQSRQRLALCDESPLDPSRLALLERELNRNRATLEVRLVDERGRRRAWLPPTGVPLDRRHEFVLEVDDLQPLIASGTVKRVGLDYLWTRL